jgi:hypothetical protein
MHFREKFLEDLRCGVLIKEDKTFKQLAKLYGYPKENGENLCKKDYYKFQKNCDKPEVSIFEYVKKEDPTQEYENLVLKSKWEVQTKGGGKDVLKSYRNDVTPLQIQQFRETLISEIKDYSPSTKYSFVKKSENQDNLLLISLPDFHIGRETLSMDIADKYIDTIFAILNKVNLSTIEKIVYVIGNDFFNTDSHYATTKGTPQFDFNTWSETWRFGKNLLLHSIEVLKSLDLPLHIVNVPGNHDYQKCFFIGDVIEAYFKHDEQITIDNSDNLFKKYTHGNTLMMFEHGEMKDSDYPLIMASEFPKEWGSSKFRISYVGHLHHQITKEYRGNCFVKFLPSLAKSSAWETSKGYKTSPKAEASIISKDNGLVYTININY